ncbi:MAG: FAD-dependent oxidoreductase, partial [Pseudomonadota bacterium]
GPDALDGPAATRPGAACPDARVANGYLLDHLTGSFQILAFGDVTTGADVDCPILHIADVSPTLRARFLGDAASAIYLLRPDQHIIARWPTWNTQAIRKAINAAMSVP